MRFINRVSILLFLLFSFVVSNAQQMHAHWDITSKKVTDCEYDVIIKVKIDHPWHMYSMKKSKAGGPNALLIKFNKSADFELIGATKESKPISEFDDVFELQVYYFNEEATFTQRVKALKEGQIKVSGKYEYQICTDAVCDFPEEKFSVVIDSKCKSGVALIQVSDTTKKDTVAQVSVESKDTTAKASLVATTTNEEPKQDGETSIVGKSWWLVYLSGFIWGFLALFTPCVFPLIPMNVSFFLKRSKNKAKGKVNAIVYALSIVTIFVTLGLGISAIWGGGALHSFSTSAGFNIVIFLMLLVFGASFLGAFEITLPSAFVNKIDQQSDRGGYVGIFFMALALVVISFSCTGPMIGNALVAASTSGISSGAFWAMFGFSSGLALPFGFFAFFPSLINSMPKSGGWLNTVKVVLGFLELALALKFASNVDLVYQWGILTREVFITLWVVIFGLMTIYLVGGFKTAHDSDVKHLSVTRIFFVIISFSITIYLIPGLWGAPLKLFSGVLPPLEYSESPHGFGGSKQVAVALPKDADEFSGSIEVNKNGIVHFKNDYDKALAYAKKVGKPLMVDFTGHACANCRKTEDNVWPDAEVIKRLNNDVVLVSLYVDDKRALDPKEVKTVTWDGREKEIDDIGDKFKYMEETRYKQSTQPLYVILDHNERVLNTPRGYKASIPDYIKWIDEGVANFKKVTK